MSGTEPGRLRLPEVAFDALAAGEGSAEVIRLLLDGQWSRRLVLLLAFRAAAGPSIEPAWAALENAQRQAPDEVAGLLMHPQVGAWLAYTLRRDRGEPGRAAGDFEQLHTVALAAAALAGQPYRARVPLRHGRVMVPRFGMASFPDCAPWDTADAETAGGRIRFRRGDQRIEVPATPGVDAPGWWALRRLTVGTEPALTVWLDDLDPLRDLADPVPPARLGDDEVRAWAGLLRDAWAILTDRHAPLAEALAAGVTSLVPLPAADGWETRSASTGDAFGAVLCSPPPDAVTLAVSLAHEFMHIKLGGLLHLTPLAEDAGDAGRPVLYAPWRDDPRPLAGLLQGVYAFAGIAAFWRRERTGPAGDFEFAYARMQALAGLDTAVRTGRLTRHGRRFTACLCAEITTWSADPIDAEALALARLVAAGHRAGWRIRHCRPDPTTVRALATAWRRGAGGPIRVGAAEAHPDPQTRTWSAGRLGLARRRLAAPQRYPEVRTEAWATGLTDGDLALFGGDPVAAAKDFAGQLADDPESPDAWTGLGLALGAGTALLECPEVVLAVHRELGGRAHPIDLAAWLTTTIGG